MLSSSKPIGQGWVLVSSKEHRKYFSKHLTVNELDNINQSAYKTGHSTETALIKITDNVRINLAQNKPTSVVLLYLSDAFDPIDHQQLSE